MQSRQLFATVTSSSAVYFDMPFDSVIKGVLFCVNLAAISAVADYLEVELSQVSTNQTNVSDAQNIIAAASFTAAGLGTPASVGGFNGNFYAPCDSKIKGGDRIYLNYTEAGGGTWRLRSLIWF